MLKRTLLVCLTLTWLAATAASANPQAQAVEMIRAAGMGSPTISVMAVDLTDGETIVAIGPDTPMIPASNMKLVTSAAALGVLGPDFSFETQLQLIDRREDGSAIVVVKGDGDPGFGDPRLLERYAPGVNTIEQLIGLWVDAVEQSGVKHVRRLIIDDRVFDQEFIHDTWPTDQLNEWYCAQVAGFNFFNNCLLIKPRPTRVGEAPLIDIEPIFTGAAITNRAVTVAGTTATFWVSRRLGSNELTLRGNVPARGAGPATVTVHDPPMTFGQILSHRLSQRGIAVDAVERPNDDDIFTDAQVIHRVRTPIVSALARCNKNSQNLFADALLKRTGREYTGAAGSWHNGAAAVRAFLSERSLGPASAATVTVADGSGLSRDNRVTTRLLVDLLTWMDQHETFRDIYRDSLSIAGVDGSLSRRLHTQIQGRVFGKTGYINRVGSLSGYLISPAVVDADGNELAPPRTIVFSIIINDARAANHEMHQLQDRLVRLLDQNAVQRQRTAALALMNE